MLVQSVLQRWYSNNGFRSELDDRCKLGRLDNVVQFILECRNDTLAAHLSFLVWLMAAECFLCDDNVGTSQQQLILLLARTLCAIYTSLDPRGSLPPWKGDFQVEKPTNCGDITISISLRRAPEQADFKWTKIEKSRFFSDPSARS